MRDEPHGAQDQDEGDPEQLHLQRQGIGAVVEVGDDEPEVEQEKAEPREVGRQGEGQDAVRHGKRRADRHSGKEEDRAQGPRRLGIAAARPEDPVRGTTRKPWPDSRAAFRNSRAIAPRNCTARLQ